MFNALKREFRTLQDAPAGERFMRAYTNRNDADRSLWERGASIAIAGVVLVGGLIALPAPGPGTLVVIVGLGLLARGLKPAAVALDWLELRLRSVWRRIRRMWRDAGTLGRVGMAAVAGLIVLTLFGAVAFFAYRTFFSS
jgi:uncharacterized protein (TIGR02611 family)